MALADINVKNPRGAQISMCAYYQGDKGEK